MQAMINKMNQLTTDEIVSLMVQTWNKPEGTIIRDAAFEVIEIREGEDESDRIYSNLWNEFQN